MLKKDKQKVIGEELDELRVRSFLNYEPYGEEPADFHILTKAYRGLPPEPFERFLEMFIAEGHDIHAQNSSGQSFAEFIAPNSAHPEYVEILKKFEA